MLLEVILQLNLCEYFPLPRSIGALDQTTELARLLLHLLVARKCVQKLLFVM